MPTVDLVDETYLRAPLETVAAVIHQRPRWTGWWPDLVPAVFMDRGAAGIRWNITGQLVGSMEIWLEEYDQPLGGVLLHFYLRADPTGTGSTTVPVPARGRAATAESARWARSSKRNFWALKDELEAGLPR
ncbi:MAG: polyketide cyclase / dehydrase and lipid transport [Actinomycetota bacterium]|nr:polyketide cyclase / dehydrase and lipid transport [Actinomycetota bacterium]